MFGDISGMMKQLQETQKKVEETKKRLDTVFIDEETAGKVKVTVTANREIKSIQVDDSILEDAEELEDLYGNRVRSRMRQLFNLIAFDKESLDKRV